MVEKIAKWIIDHRRGVYAIILPVTIFLIYEIRYVRLYFEREDLTPNNHPYMKLQHKMEEIFGGTNLVVIGLRKKEGDIFDPISLEKIYRIADKLYFLRGIVRYRILCIASLRLVHRWTTIDIMDGEEIPYYHHRPYKRYVEDIIKAKHPEEKMRKAQQFKKIVLEDREKGYIPKGLISDDLKGTVIYADFEWERDYRHIFKQIKKILEAEEDEVHSFHVAGRMIELGYLHEYVRRMVSIFGIALAMIFLFLFICFGTWRGVWIPLFGAFIALAWLLGFLGLLRARLDVLTLCVPFIAMAIATSHSVQIIKRYYEEFLNTKDKVSAAAITLEGLIEPAIMAVITDGLGFGSLALFEIRVLRYMGIVMGLGIISIFLVVTILIHCLLASLPAPSMRSAERAMRPGILDRLLRSFAIFSLGRNRWVVFAVALIVLAIGIAGTQRVTVGFTRPGTPNLWADSKYNKDEEILNKYFLGTNSYYIYVAAKEQEDLIYKPHINMFVEKLQRHLEKRPDVGATLSYVDELKVMAKQRLGKYKVPETPAETYEMFERWVTSTEPEGNRNYFELDYRQANIQVYMKNHNAHNIRDIIKDTEEFVKKNRNSDVEIRPAAGLIGIYAAIMDEIKHKTLYDTFVIVAAIIVLCSIGFRSFWGGIAVLLPLGIAKILTYGILGFTNEGLFVSTVAIMAPGMGVGVDYSIYTLARLREEARRKEQDPNEAFVIALTTAGKAVFYVAMSVALGVAVLWLSWIRLQAVMGGLLAVVVTLNMLAALLVLPSLIATWRPRFIYG